MLDNFFKKVYNILTKQREVNTMENFEKDKYYLETPFSKNFEEFQNYHEKIWKEHWSNHAVEIIQDAYCVGISEMLVEKDLCENNYINIYENIIVKCRSLEWQANLQEDKAWKEQLKKTRQHYQVELLKTLTTTIRDYCMEED